MSQDSVIRQVQREYQGFSLSDTEDDSETIQAAYTPQAWALQQWVEMLLSTFVGSHPNVYRLAEAKVLLLDRFFSLWHSTPRGERSGGRSRKGLFDTFEEAHGRLRTIELSLMPEKLFAPPAPSTSPPPIPEITLGEIVGEVG